jgi:hypothetical protein
VRLCGYFFLQKLEFYDISGFGKTKRRCPAGGRAQSGPWYLDYAIMIGKRIKPLSRYGTFPLWN